MTMKARQAGMTLLELLLAAALGLLLTLAIVQLHATTQRGFQLQNAQLAMQDQARFALGQLSRSIHAAGFMAGADPQALQWLPAELGAPSAAPCSHAWLADLRWPLRGYPGGPISPLPGCTLAGYLADSDILVLRGADAQGHPGTGYLPSAAVAALDDDSLVFRSLPDAAGIVYSAREHHQAVARLGGIDDAGGALSWRYQAEVYHVAMPSGGGHHGAVLYLRALRHGSIAQPLIDGVELLRIYYLVDTDDDAQPDRWLRADQLEAWQPDGAGWARVRLLRIVLLLRSDAVANRADTRQYRLPDGSLYQPPAAVRHHPRQLYVHDVRLRNRS